MAKHINSLTIETYRGIKNLKLQNFGDVNIFTGGNNSGKTSVLELIMSLKDPLELSTWKDIIEKRNSWRRINHLSVYEAIGNLFDVDSDNKVIEYLYDIENQKKHIKIEEKTEIVSMTRKQMEKLTLFFDEEDLQEPIEDVERMNLFYYEDGVCKNDDTLYEFERVFVMKMKKESNFAYISSEENISGNYYLGNVLNDADSYQELLQVLKNFDEDIVSINASESKQGRSIVYQLLSRHHKKAIPVNMYGDGMKKALILMGAICSCKNGVIIIDEFETGIHTSGMQDIFKWILETCKKFNIQVFMSSHSIEAIKKLIQSGSGLDIDMKLYTLYRKEGKNLARTMDAREALEFNEEMGLELR